MVKNRKRPKKLKQIDHGKAKPRPAYEIKRNKIESCALRSSKTKNKKVSRNRTTETN